MTKDELVAVQNKIKYVIVLMLENRSFDHMLGFSGITGNIVGVNKKGPIEGLDPNNLPYNLDSNNKKYYPEKGAPFILDLPDPGHEFSEVLIQLTGKLSPEYDPTNGNYPADLNNSGFVLSYENQKTPPADISAVMKCFAPEQLPVLNQLAREFAVCDHWFSSLPGPTWPNRFFMHAADAAGLDGSPSLGEICLREFISGYHFKNGTIYQRLNEHKINWVIYAGDKFPQCHALKGLRTNDMEDFENFKNQINKPGFPSYTFIEPDYGHFLQGNFRGGNSQHPLDDVTRGEKLIKDTYEIIRQSKIWNETLFIITYDEHGGLFDHVPPPKAVPPGDFKDKDYHLYQKNGFNFKQYGVRVPAIIISSWIPQNMIDQRTYDHTSILATLERLFEVPPLTERDRHANDFLDLLTLDSPRNTPVILEDPADSQAPSIPDNVKDESIDPSIVGFVHIASMRDYEVSPPAERHGVPAKAASIETRSDALDYLKEVKARVQ